MTRNTARKRAGNKSVGIGTRTGHGHEKLFASEEAEQAKRELCEMGRRMWQREYVEGNGGNLSYRLRPGKVLCTPTLVSKGFLTPEMICMVDLDGKQLAGERRVTSEITTHLAIYRGSVKAKAVCHAHPPYATAFAIAGVEPPDGLLPEKELFVGKIPLLPYRRPGSSALADLVHALASKHQGMLMGNHGVICWGTAVEDSYFKMEIVESYCKTLAIAAQLPSSRNMSLSGKELLELLKWKKKLGLPDAREGMKVSEFFKTNPWTQLRSDSGLG